MEIRIVLVALFLQLTLMGALGKPLNVQEEKVVVKLKKLTSGIDVVQTEHKGLICKVVTASLETEKNVLQFKQLNDGKKLLSLIYSSGMVDCDWTIDEDVITNFVRDFYSFTGNKTVVDHADVITRKDFKRLKRHCKVLQKTRRKKMKKNRFSRKRKKMKKKNKYKATSHEEDQTMGETENWMSGWCKGGDELQHCCSKHANCDVTVGGLSRGYGLTNRRITQLSHCDCDKSFRECLKNVDSAVSDLTGLLYFNYLQPECFVLKPKDKCRKRSWWGHCNKYELIMSGQTLPSAPWNQT